MELYYSNSFFNRVLRKMILSFGLPGDRLVLNKWIDEIKNYDEIILFDTGNAAGLIRWIRKRYPEKRLILWYWNPVEKTIPLESVTGLGAEIWSFDPSDCRKYGLKYNTQFYFRENQMSFPAAEDMHSDVFFVGTDKNRTEMLSRLKEVFDAASIRYTFHLVRYKGAGNTEIEYQEPLKYREVLLRVAGTKAVLDLVSEGQHGLTLRPLEALFYKKKLITNMKNITEFSVYDPENIFILGLDAIEDLPAFIASPFNDERAASLSAFYSMDSWLERFDGPGDICDCVLGGEE